MRRAHSWFPVLAITPYMILGIVVGLYPLWILVRMAFSHIGLASGHLVFQFDGLAHLTRALHDTVFLASLGHVGVFILIGVSVEVLLGLGLALMVWRLQGRWVSVVRTTLLIPLLIPPVAISIVWWLIYNEQFGFLNILLRGTHLPVQNWLTNPHTALFAVIWVDIWHWTPLVFLFLYTQLLTISPELIEAARLDGASEGQLTRHVILPHLGPMLGVSALFRLVFTFKIFDEIYILTSGGPGTATEIPSLYIQQVFFNQFSYGYGSFLGFVIFVMVLVALGVALLGRKGWVGWKGRRLPLS